jgi:hypothetical protein
LRKALVGLVKWGLFSTVLYLVGRELVRRVADVNWSEIHFRPAFLAAAFCCRAAGSLIFNHASYLVMRPICPAPPWWTLYGVLSVSRIGRYLPGKFASVVGAAWMLRRRGVAVQATTAMLFVRQGLSVVLGLLVAVPLTLWRPIADRLPLAWLWCLVLAACGAVCLHPKVFYRLVNRLLALFRLPPLEGQQRLKDYVLPLATMAAGLALGGFTYWLQASSITEVSLAWYPVLLCGGALANVAGFLAVFTPGGLGVQDGISLIILGQVVGGAESAIIVLLLRLFQVVTETTFAGAGLLLLRFGPGKPGPPEPSFPTHPE